MIEFGNTLRTAREAKGLTISQIAESTHMMASIVQDMENENFTRIVAPIYGRGFVKLYCEAVGLDPKPLVAEFMEIYNGNRVPTIRERPVAAAPEQNPPSTPEPEPQPEPVPQAAFTATPEPIPEPPPPAAATPVTLPETPEPSADLGPLFGGSAEPAEEPPAEPVRETPPQASAEPPEAPQTPARTLSRYASPLQEEPKESRIKLPSISIPPSFWRLLMLAVVAGFVLWGVFLGVRALYRITNDIRPAEAPKAETPAATPVAAPAPAKDQSPAIAPKPAPTPRTPQKIPSLYVD